MISSYTEKFDSPQFGVSAVYGSIGLEPAERYVLDCVINGGEVYQHGHLFEDLEAALAFRDRVAAYVRKCEHWRPAAACWFFVRRVYGSEAYARHRQEEEQYLESLAVELEHGVGSYGPAHPAWPFAGSSQIGR